MRYLVMLEPTEAGFAVQVPDLAIATFGETVEAARQAATTAIELNLDAYRDAGMAVPQRQPASVHLENPDFKDLLFTYVEVAGPSGKLAA